MAVTDCGDVNRPVSTVLLFLYEAACVRIQMVSAQLLQLLLLLLRLLLRQQRYRLAVCIEGSFVIAQL